MKQSIVEASVANAPCPAAMPGDGTIDKEEFPAKNDSETSMRSLTSDLETVPAARKRRESKASSSTGSETNLASAKEASNRPYDFAFTQQRMKGWQPILTPYNVLPVLFILGLIFVPLGVVFLTASFSVVEVTYDYTTFCEGKSACEVPLEVTKDMKGPVFVYYKLTNYYQNNRLYAKSFSTKQLKGEALTVAELASSCDPLVGTDKPYYPCGLIANSYFSDMFTSLKLVDKDIPIGAQGITWPADVAAYGKSAYAADDVLIPPSWSNFPDDLKKEFNIVGDKYVGSVPDLANNQRFINWMKVAGFPAFRKLYGRIEQSLDKGTYKMIINSNYDVQKFGGTKSVVLSTTTWAGGQNSALGWAFVAVGGVLLVLGLFFLGMFMMSPRKVGDVSYLSWYNENLGDIVEEVQ